MSKFGGKSIADRRKFFQQAMEAEQKAATKVHRPPRRAFSESDTTKRMRELNMKGFESIKNELKSEVVKEEHKEQEEIVNETKKVSLDENRNESGSVTQNDAQNTSTEGNGKTAEAGSTAEDENTSKEDESKEPTSPTSPTKREPRVLKKKPHLKRQMSVSSLVLSWCQDMTKDYPGVDIKNFSGSFTNGLAFCALIHKFNPDKFDFDALDPEDRRHNWTLAVETGESVGIPALFDIDQMLRLKRPEPRSVQCYIQMIFSKYKPKDLDMSNLIIA